MARLQLESQLQRVGIIEELRRPVCREYSIHAVRAGPILGHALALMPGRRPLWALLLLCRAQQGGVYVSPRCFVAFNPPQGQAQSSEQPAQQQILGEQHAQPMLGAPPGSGGQTNSSGSSAAVTQSSLPGSSVALALSPQLSRAKLAQARLKASSMSACRRGVLGGEAGR